MSARPNLRRRRASDGSIGLPCPTCCEPMRAEFSLTGEREHFEHFEGRCDNCGGFVFVTACGPFKPVVRPPEGPR